MRPLFLSLCAVVTLAGLPVAAAPLHPRLVAKSSPGDAFAADLGAALRAGLDSPAPRRGRLPTPIPVLLVEWSAGPRLPGLSSAAVHSLFFGAGPSLQDYYARSSFGRYQVQGETSAWLQMPRPFDFYADGRRGIGGAYPRNARALVEDAVRAADSQVDFSRFDNDGPDGIAASGDDDGFVDALVVVHAGGTAETSGDAEDLLSHCWFTEHSVETDDGVSVWRYALVGATSPLGVRSHEFGHLLGLADLYDRNAQSRQGPGGLGDWSLMGSGSWLGDGEQPADLDAPSKIELEFVDPIVPRTNATGLALVASSAGVPPTIYRVWSHGLFGLQYFVIENRRPTGLDARLPGGGMLVYHVDLTRATNDGGSGARVRLLQADGRDDLGGYANPGDAGDAWPGSGSQCCRLDATTQPNTRAVDGSDTEIAIANISSPTGTMHFDLQVENRALLRLASQSVRETNGDGDGIVEAGEIVELALEIENLGLDATGVDLVWRAEPEASVVWETASATFPTLAKDARAAATFRLQPAALLGDPATLILRGTARDASGAEQELVCHIGIGAESGFLACLQPVQSAFTRDCDDPNAPWQVELLAGDATWELQDSPGDLGQVFRNARAARYPNAADVALVSPPFNLRSGSELYLLHAYATADLDAGWAEDGGRVEISLAGGGWEALEPREGYPRRLLPESVPQLAGAGVFAGRSPRRWDAFDLGARSGSARVRFRFASNDSLAGTGWEIARVEVRLPLVEPLASDIRLVAEPNPVRFPTRLAFRVESSRTQAARPTRLKIFDLRGRIVQDLEHAAVPAQSARFTWDGTDRAGRAVASGVYWARLEWGTATTTTKLLVLR